MHVLNWRFPHPFTSQSSSPSSGSRAHHMYAHISLSPTFAVLAQYARRCRRCSRGWQYTLLVQVSTKLWGASHLVPLQVLHFGSSKLLLLHLCHPHHRRVSTAAAACCLFTCTKCAPSLLLQRAATVRRYSCCCCWAAHWSYAGCRHTGCTTYVLQFVFQTTADAATAATLLLQKHRSLPLEIRIITQHTVSC
jgi:hypothetical protein